MLAARGALSGTYLKLDNDLWAALRNDDTCQRLITEQGVREVIALTIRAALRDPTRFRSARTPRPLQADAARSSVGETDNLATFTQARDPKIRSALHSAAHALSTCSSG